MDFIIKLPKFYKPIIEVHFDNITIIIDKLIKYAYFISYREINTTKELTYIFFKIVVNQYRLL
jgi:hypothetical protein